MREWKRRRERQAAVNNTLLLERLKQIQETGGGFTAAAGFDGVADAIVRVIKNKDARGWERYFQTIEEFGQYLISKKNMSCSLEMELQQEKIGGNMTIFSNSLGRLGIPVHCIGSLGEPRVYPLFHSMSENCTLHTVCRMGKSNALEFFDGKVMLYEMAELAEMSWEMICRRLGRDLVVDCFASSDLIALLNWSELPGAPKLFEEVYSQCIKTGKEKGKWALLDLSDASGKKETELLQILELSQRINRHRRTILSLNENEGRLIYKALFREEAPELSGMGERLIRYLRVDYLILHLADRAYGYQGREMAMEMGYYTRIPKISTGGGDNFNAGLCFGLLQGFSLRESLRLGNAVSGYYVRTGESPQLGELLDFMGKAGEET